MADWIRVQKSVHDDPQVIAMAAELGISTAAAVGHLVALWIGMADHARHGTVDKIHSNVIESWARWNLADGAFAERFAVHFVRNGRVKNWEKYNGKPLRLAEIEAERKRAYRRRMSRRRSGGRPADGPETVAGPEKYGRTRRTDELLQEKQQLPADVFDEAWAAYPKRPNNSRADAWRAWQARVRAGADPAAMLAGVQAYASYVEREHTEPQYVKRAATFFGPGEHWLADYAPPPARMVPLYDANGLPSREAVELLGVPRQ